MVLCSLINVASVVGIGGGRLGGGGGEDSQTLPAVTSRLCPPWPLCPHAPLCSELVGTQNNYSPCIMRGEHRGGRDTQTYMLAFAPFVPSTPAGALRITSPQQATK